MIGFRGTGDLHRIFRRTEPASCFNDVSDRVIGPIHVNTSGSCSSIGGFRMSCDDNFATHNVKARSELYSHESARARVGTL